MGLVGGEWVARGGRRRGRPEGGGGLRDRDGARRPILSIGWGCAVC